MMLITFWYPCSPSLQSEAALVGFFPHAMEILYHLLHPLFMLPPKYGYKLTATFKMRVKHVKIIFKKDP